ncbi:uncharacterized protein LOC129942371 [Eupeodes corollae]|uniref:uncharacterized protein LOC129942371 n=1 Tax=Eupeodes corollae TaxID=290404 RepID=UPI00248F8EF7|nr:uncharacterized protein LOC129942371 [Eupeodes corollae]
MEELEELSDESARDIQTSRTRTFNLTDENETSRSNTARTNDINSIPIPKFNTFEDSLHQRNNRSNTRINTPDEVEYIAQNLNLKQAISTDSIVSRGSRNFPRRHSPLGSFRSIRNSTRRDSNRNSQNNGINIIMVIGFGFVIGLGWVFNNIEIFLKWFQFKLNEFELQLFKGKSIREFYAKEKSMSRKCLLSPLGGLCYLLQMLVFVFLKSFEILKKPAPKGLVNNVFNRYIKD